MKVVNVRVNGIKNPVGYLMNRVSCSWKVVDTKAKKAKTAKIEVSGDKDFQEIILHKEGASLCQAGEELELKAEACKRYYLRVTVTTDLGETAVSETAFFETAKEENDWVGNWITTEEGDTFHPVFVKTISIDKPIASARLYISGLGLYTATLNGGKLGEEVLTPYYSNYRQEIQYITYDITGQLQQTKENTLEVALGNCIKTAIS